MNPFVFILGQQVFLSSSTIEKILNYSAFCSADQAWLMQNDSKGKSEQEHIDKVACAMHDDFNKSIMNLTSNEFNDLNEQFFELVINDWWDDALKACK